MPPQQQNNYDFILNADHKPPRGPLFGNSMGARIAVIAVLVVVIIVIGVVVSSFLGKAGRAQNQRLVEIAQTQAELIRVSALASKPESTKTLSTQTAALTTRLSLESSQQQTKKMLANRGINEKGLAKQLASGKNPKTDATLDEAIKNSRFDETYTALVNKQLADYQKLLQAAYPGATPNERTVLTALYENADKLVVKTATNQ